MDFAGAHRIDQHAIAPHQIEDRDVRARLLGVADDIELGQVGNPLADRGRVVNVRRRAKLPGQLRDGLAGDFGQESRLIG